MLFEVHCIGVIVNYDYVCDIKVCETDFYAYAFILIESTVCFENDRNRKAIKVVSHRSRRCKVNTVIRGYKTVCHCLRVNVSSENCT